MRSVTGPLKGTPLKLAPGVEPRHPHPILSGTPALPPVRTGGTQVNTDGIASGLPGVTGAVGEQQYVQLAAGRMAVFRKQDGAMLTGPAATHALFAGAARGARDCAIPHATTGSVEYDRHAKRWVVAHLATFSGQATYCIAVSTTSDATGPYHLYAMKIQGAGGAALDVQDARMALWSGAWYASFSVFDDAHGAWRGARVCAMDRAALLRGRDTVARCVNPGSAFGPVVVAGLEGDAQPAHGTPAMLIALDFDGDGNGARLLLWRFHFSLAAAGIGEPVAIPVAPFRIACANGVACIGQPHPGVSLFAQGDRLLPRAAYRHDAGRETLVLAHAVQMDDGRSALRWYELRAPLQAIQVYQQGTHTPDHDHRTMGSIGADKAGNIALGFSVAGSDTPPGMRYTGRHRSDPPGRMQAEEFIVNGAGVQLAAAHRMPASGALSLDPTDGCTFWYTQHYLPLTGHNTWRTRIASFKFGNCT